MITLIPLNFFLNIYQIWLQFQVVQLLIEVFDIDKLLLLETLSLLSDEIVKKKHEIWY